MIKKSKSTDSDGKQPEDQVAQAKTGLAEAGSKSSHSVSSKDTAHGNKGKSVAKKTDGEELDLSLNTGAESAADPIVLAQAETGTATDAATAGSSSSAAGTAGGGAGSAASGAATGAEGAGAFALSDAALGTMILGGVVGVAAIASTGGAAAAAPAATPIVGFILSGTIALGKVNNTASDLIVEAFKANGTKLTATGGVNADGTYTVTVTENYTGPVMIRLHDINTTNTNYTNEVTGASAPLSTDLRVVVNVTGSGGVSVSAAITPLTELAVRKLVGDSGVVAGGVAGAAGTVIGAKTAADVDAANNSIKTAFGLSGDITTTTPVTVDNADPLTGFAAATTTTLQQDYGRALAAISGMEASGQNAAQVLNTIAQGVVGDVLSQSVVNQLSAGATAVVNNIGLNPGAYAAGAATAVVAGALNTLINPANVVISILASSADTGAITNDFITNTATQTITATLAALATPATLANHTKLWGSLDGGTTWTDIIGSVTGTALSWGVTLNPGNNIIKLAVTADTLGTTVGTVTTPAFTGATADIVGRPVVQNYVLDAVVPNAPVVALASVDTAVATAAEATAGAVTVNAENNARVDVIFTNGLNTVTKAVIGAGAARTVGLTTTEQGQLGNGAVTVSAVATDAAGNISAASTAGSGSFTLDTVAPVAPVVAVVAGAAAATAAEATAGAVTVNAETGATVAVTFTNGANTVTKTVTGTGAAQAVALAAGDLTTLGNGAVTVSAVATDVAGNASTAGTGSFTLDTVAPVTPVVAVVAGAAAATAAEATAGAVTVNAETGTSVAVTFTNGANTVTKTVNGTGAALAVTLAAGDLTTLGDGAITVSAVATDVAGNASTAGTGSFTLDTVAPLAPSAPTDVAAGAIINAAEATAGVAVLASLTGTGAVAGDTIELKVGGASFGTPLTHVLTAGDITNGYTFTVASGTLGADGAKSLTTVVTDVAGNAGAASPALALTLDTIAPAITFSNPTLSTDSGISGDFITNTGISQTITATLSAALGAGDIVQGSLDNGTTWADITSSVAGTTLTLTGQTLTGSNTFKLKVTDNAGNDGAIASQAYVIDSTAPTLSSSTPTDGSLTATAAGNIVLTFSENVAAGTGNIVITNANTAGDTRTIAVTDATQVTISNNTITINPTADLILGGAYNVQVANTAITDIAGNAYAGIADATTLNFVTANNPSVTIGTNHTALNNTVAAALTFTLSEAATNFTAADVSVIGGALSGFTGSGTSYTAIFTPTAGSTTAATVNVASGAFTNAFGFTNTAATQLSMAVDTVAPTLSSSTPADNASNVPSGSIVLTFSEAVAAGTGDIIISDGTTPYNIAVGDTTQIAFSGSTVTITPTGGAAPSTAYNIQMGSGVILDAAGNNYAGIVNATTLNFATAAAPTITSNIAGVTNFDVTSNIVLNSTENVSAATGKYIHIVNDANSTTGTAGLGFHGEATTNTQDILVTDTTQVTILNNTITIHPQFGLDLANNYHILVDAGAFVGATSHMGSIGITSPTADSFSTVTPGNGSTLGVAGAVASQAMDAAGLLTAGHSWLDIQAVGAPSAPAGTTLDLSGGNIAMVFQNSDIINSAGPSYDGITAPAAGFWVNATNFGTGDLVYVDNQSITKTTDLAVSTILSDTNGLGAALGTGEITFNPTTVGAGGNPGWIDLTPVAQPATTIPFTVSGLPYLQALLQTSYVPIVSA